MGRYWVRSECSIKVSAKPSGSVLLKLLVRTTQKISSVVAPPGKEALSKLTSLFREELETQGVATAPLAGPPRRWRSAVCWERRIGTAIPYLLVWHGYFSSKLPLAWSSVKRHVLYGVTPAPGAPRASWDALCSRAAAVRDCLAASHQSSSLVTSISRSPRTSVLQPQSPAPGNFWS